MTCKAISRRAALAVGTMGLLSLACGLLDTPRTVLINNREVNLPREGGSVDVLFRGVAGQPLLITLRARTVQGIPHALLTGPSGLTIPAPPPGTAVDGVNSIVVTPIRTGAHTLRVFDNARLGGTIIVRVEVAPAE